MRRVCAWCGRELGQLTSEHSDQDVITHGLCEECHFHLSAQIGLPLREYLDGLEEPVVVVDESGVVQTANKRACALLQKELPAIEGYRGGEVFECVHATLPEGCGQTIHCSGCTIRRAVMETFHTGQSRLRTPAYLNHEGPEGVAKIGYLISTEKVGEVVLLRIDAVGT